MLGSSASKCLRNPAEIIQFLDGLPEGSDAPVADRCCTRKSNVASLHLIRLCTNFHSDQRRKKISKNVARKAEVHIYLHCLGQALVADRYCTLKSNVDPLHLTRLCTKFYANLRLFTVPAGKG